MASDDPNAFTPLSPLEPPKARTNRTILGLLTLLLIAAVVLALWFLVFDDDSSDEGTVAAGGTGPTPLPIPTSTPAPTPLPSTGDGATTDQGDDDGQPAAPATPEPTVEPTPIPDGFEACAPAAAPNATTSYLVDTTTTPLNQRTEPAVSSDLAGSFDSGLTGLFFTGECLVNTTDGYTWWQIDNGTTLVWVASDFVSPE